MSGAEWALAVDLGTTACSGVIRTGDRIEVLEIDGARTVPATVLATPDSLIAGRVARHQTARNPAAAVHDPKRRVGGPPLVLDGRAVPVADALAALLTLFADEGIRRFDGHDPARLVLTHPASWAENQLGVLRTAAVSVLPGVPVTLLAEPIAAAQYYVHEKLVSPGSTLAIYDLGGGTFDTAVVKVTGSSTYEVLGRPGGSAAIGGNEFDHLVFDHFSQQLRRIDPEWWETALSSESPRDRLDVADVLNAARSAKEALSRTDAYSEFIRGANADVSITRDTLIGLIETNIDESVRLLRLTIESSGIEIGQLAGVFVTGGGSRTPLVAEKLATAFGENRLRTRDDPKLVTALGAAHSLPAARAADRSAPQPADRENHGPTPPKSAPPNPATTKSAPPNPATTKSAPPNPAPPRPAPAKPAPPKSGPSAQSRPRSAPSQPGNVPNPASPRLRPDLRVWMVTAQVRTYLGTASPAEKSFVAGFWLVSPLLTLLILIGAFQLDPVLRVIAIVGLISFWVRVIRLVRQLR